MFTSPRIAATGNYGIFLPPSLFLSLSLSIYIYTTAVPVVVVCKRRLNSSSTWRKEKRVVLDANTRHGNLSCHEKNWVPGNHHVFFEEFVTVSSIRARDIKLTGVFLWVQIYGDAGKADRAVALFQAWDEQGVAMDHFCFNAVIGAVLRNGWPRKALEVCACVCVCIFLIDHKRAIRPCHPSHSMPLALILPRGGQ